VSINRLFHQRLNLSPGEFIVQFLVEKKYAALPYFHIKKTKNEKIDYPLISLCAILEEGSLKLALSGLCEFPFRSAEMETELNRKDVSPEARVRNAVDLAPGPVLNDVSGSDRYRLFVLKNTLMNLGKELEG
jgi:xanthine dehydrogenase molybdenum-binding subunit